MVKYTTREGDMLDAIVHRQYGSTKGRIVEQVMQANPQTAELGPELPAGVTLDLPDVAQEASERSVRLWD